MSKVDQASVGVIILTYNSAQYIIHCIQSVLANNYNNFTVLIVDNASTDNTVHLIKHTFPHLPILQNKKNLGYAAGNNIGIKYFIKQNSQYILLLNPDTTVSKLLLKSLTDVLQEDRTIGVAGPMIMYMHDRKKIWFAGGYFNKIFCYTRHPHMNEYFEQKAGSAPLSPLQKTDFITGACLMIRTSIIQQTSLLPEGYFMYFEDVAFCQTIRKFQYTCMLVKRPLVSHRVSAAGGKPGSNVLTSFKAYYFARNPLLYIKHNVHGFRMITNFAGQFFIRLPRYTIQFIRYRNMQAFIGYLKGIRDGLQS